MIRINYPNATTEHFYSELNKIARLTMRDPKSDYWIAE